jgi:hypothetical protein
VVSRAHIVIADRDSGARAEESLTAWLSQRLGYRVEDLVVYSGSDSPARKVTALALAAEGARHVVKIADTAAGSEALQRETATLRTLAETPLATQVPEVILTDRWADRADVQVQTALPHGLQRQEPVLTAAHVGFLVELSRLERQTLPLGETALARTVLARLNECHPGDLPLYAAAVARELRDGVLAGPVAACHRTHGDFAPWNIRRDGNRVLVFDWEDSRPDGLALSDAWDFMFRQAALVGPWQGAAALVTDMQRTGRQLAREAELGEVDIGAMLALWALAEHLLHSNPLAIRVADEAGRRCHG